MRIGINCRSFLKKNYAGIGRYTFNLIKCLAKSDRENEYTLYVNRRLFDLKKSVPAVPGKNFKIKIDYLNRGLDNSLGQVDAYHSPSPDFIKFDKGKIIVTVHDLIYKTYPQGHTEQTCTTTDKQMSGIVKQAEKIICCSRSTMDDMKKIFSVDDKRLELVYQGVDKEIFYPVTGEEDVLAREALKRKGGSVPYILFVGTLEPRKNLTNILKAFAVLKAKKKFMGKLIIIGMKGWMVDDINPLIKKLGIEDFVVFTGYVSDQELRWFYNLAEVFVFPSFYEGFGFPIVEAFSCGTAVITSNVSSCPEVAADAALKVNPYEVSEIVEAVSRILGDKKLKEILEQKGLKRSGDFSFMNTAKHTLEVYQKVCAG